MIKTKCPICFFEGKIAVKPFIENRELLLCPNCLAEFVYPQLEHSEIKKMYERQYSYWTGASSMADSSKKATFDSYLQQLKIYKNTGTLLDIGTGTGLFLEQAAKENFNVFGIEPAENASLAAKNKIGTAKIHSGTLEDCGFSKEKFDIITVCDVLEHIKDPVNTLKLSSELLKKDGYIMVIMPDNRSFISYFLKSARKEYKLEHLYYFNRKTIEKIFESAGLKVIFKKPVMKSATINYIYMYLRQYKMYCGYHIFAVLKFIPLLNTFKFKIPSGSFQYILQKKDTAND